MKMKRIFQLALFLFILITPERTVDAQSGFLLLVAPASAGCSQATTFLARTTGLSGTESTAMTNLICGMVTDGLITGTLTGATGGCGTIFDVLVITATNSSTSLLNICGTSYSAVINGSPTFVQDVGYTGASTLNYLDTGFNPSTASSPNYTQNIAHFSFWSNTAAQGNNPPIGIDISTHILPDYGNPGTYMRINDSSASGVISSSPNGAGFYLASRTSSSNRVGYWDSTALGTANSVTSQAVSNADFTVLATSLGATSYQVTMYSIGAALNSTQAGNFYSRLRTYMTAVGVP